MFVTTLVTCNSGSLNGIEIHGDGQDSCNTAIVA